MLPIDRGDVAVFPGDILAGDDDGIMVIPNEIIEEVIEECIQMTLFEDFVIEQVQNGQSIKGLYPPTNPETMKDFEQWKIKKSNTL